MRAPQEECRGSSSWGAIGGEVEVESLVEPLRGRIEAKTARAEVMGLGFVGLPLSMEFARAGFPVVGLDVDPERVELLRAGRSYIPDVSDAALEGVRATGRVAFTTDFDALDLELIGRHVRAIVDTRNAFARWTDRAFPGGKVVRL